MQDIYLLDQDYVARFIGKSVQTLQRWRQDGTGPAWVRVGRTPKYHRDDLAAWVDANRSIPATRKVEIAT